MSVQLPNSLAHRRASVTFWLVAAFLLLSPMSVAGDLPFVGACKYLRVFVTAALVAIGIVKMPLHRLGSASKALLLFVVVYWLAALWSTAPLWGLFHKGLLVLTVGSGIWFVYSLRDAEELVSRLKMLGLVAAVSAVVLLYAAMGTSAGAVATHGRFATFGMNPNTIGSTAALLLLLTWFSGLYGDTRSGRTIGWVGSGLLLVIILASGSRASVILAIAGAGIIAVPRMRRPGWLLLLLVGLGMACYLLLEMIGFSGAERLIASSGWENRAGIWRAGVRHFSAHPLIGVGWLHTGSHSGSVQNIALQVAAETGIVGLVLLVGVIVVFATRCHAVLQLLRRHAWPSDTTWLAIGIVTAIFAHGVAEASALLGTTINAFLLGFGFALIDRVFDQAHTEDRRLHFETPESSDSIPSGMPMQPVT